MAGMDPLSFQAVKAWATARFGRSTAPIGASGKAVLVQSATLNSGQTALTVTSGSITTEMIGWDHPGPGRWGGRCASHDHDSQSKFCHSGDSGFCRGDDGDRCPCTGLPGRRHGGAAGRTRQGSIHGHLLGQAPTDPA